MQTSDLDSALEAPGKYGQLRFSLSVEDCETLFWCLAEFTAATHLYLVCPSLSALPSDLELPPNLRVMDLRHTGATSVPDGLSKRVEVRLASDLEPAPKPSQETLDQWMAMERGMRTSMDQALDYADTTYHLDLSGQGLGECAGRVAELVNLQGLDLRRNKIRELPNSLGTLTRLQEVDLRENPISAAEQERIRAAWPHLLVRFS